MDPRSIASPDTLAKSNSAIAKIMNEALAIDYHTHLDISYVVMNDCPEKLQAASSTRTEIGKTLIEAAYQICTD